MDIIFGHNGDRLMDVSRQIPAAQFKQHCLSLMDDLATSGGEFIITKHGRPVCRLVPLNLQSKKSRFGRMKGKITFHGDITAPTGESWDIEK